MAPGTSIEMYLERLASGDVGVRDALLRLLAGHVVFTPVTLFSDDPDSPEKKRIKVYTIEEEGQRIVLTFTSEDLLLEFGENFQCLPVSGGDLALTLPAGTVIRINSGSKSEYTLTQKEVSILGELDLGMEFVQTAPEVTEVSESVLKDVATEDLSQLFVSYPEVREAFFLEHHTDLHEAVLGLLVEAQRVDRRFVLMTEIGEVARARYGYVGAIEVFDDLNSKHSGSWELFKAISPFYVAEDEPPLVENLPGVEAELSQMWGVIKERRQKLLRR